MPGYETDTVVQLETNLDDVSPEVLGAVMDKLFAAGALDVWFAPVHMKKNRPGVTLGALCGEPLAEKLADIIFVETTAFGLRMQRVQRMKLVRRFESVHTQYGDVTVKLGSKGEQVVQFAPEFESCRSAAGAAGVPLRDVYHAALEAARNAFGSSSAK